MPARLTELDERTPFIQQLQASEDGPVVLINKFAVPSEDAVDGFVAAWTEAAEVMKRQPGFVSTRLHRGTAGSLTFVNVAHWESGAALASALTQPAFLATHPKYPDGTESSPHVFRTLSVPGIA